MHRLFAQVDPAPSDVAPGATEPLVEYWPWLVALIAVIVAVGAVWFVLRRRQRAAPPPLEPNLKIDVGSLSQAGPPAHGPRLEIYHVPVRLAVLVLAPTGRGAELPPNDQLPTIVDEIVPGFMDVLRAHQPEFRRWPGQLSTQGFATTLFANLALPGDRGKGTPWCAMAGRIDAQGKKLLVGLAVCAASPNGLGHINVERETDWLGILRVVNAYDRR
jgi:hypothetical protein